MTIAATIIVSIIGILVMLVVLAWLGLRVKPQPFPPSPEQIPPLDTVDLPADLPSPVSRFYQTIMGDQVPVIESVVITGRGSLRFRGITFPARLRAERGSGAARRRSASRTGQPPGRSTMQLGGIPKAERAHWAAGGVCCRKHHGR